MTTYQHAAPAPQRTGGTDVAAWALVALIVALVCAAAGWALASSGTASRDDVARASELAARDGLVRGEASGYAAGARLGRKESSLRAKSIVSAERARAAREGYDAGYYAGRVQAGDPNAFMSAGAAGGAYPAAGYEDILAADLFGSDAPGYSSSAFADLGYGTGGTLPHLGTTSRGTSLGDDYSIFGY